MSEAIVHNIAETRPAQKLPQVKANQAVSCLAPFETIRHLLADSPPPRRPNRNRPVGIVDSALREELDAWDAASDEALNRLETELPE